MTTRSIKYTCRGPRDDNGNRIGCAANLTQLIAKVPEDGKDHEITCPQCSNVSSVRKVPVEELAE